MPSDQEKQRKAIWAERFMEHKDRLLSLAKRNLKPVLCKRVTPEDVVQDTLSAACDKIVFFENQPEIPLYCKLRIILFQTIATLERYHLQSQKRDAHKEVEVSERDTAATGQVFVYAVTLKPSGSFATISVWLIQHTLSPMIPSKSGLKVSVTFFAPYSRAVPRVTVPPISCAISCIP